MGKRGNTDRIREPLALQKMPAGGIQKWGEEQPRARDRYT